METVFSGEMTGAWCTTDNAVGNDSSNGPTGVVLHMYLTLWIERGLELSLSSFLLLLDFFMPGDVATGRGEGCSGV